MDSKRVREEYPRFVVPGFMPFDPALVKSLEEEIVDPYRTTLLRLEKAGCRLDGEGQRWI